MLRFYKSSPRAELHHKQKYFIGEGKAQEIADAVKP